LCAYGTVGIHNATTFSRLFKDQSGKWRNGISFTMNDTEALVNAAHEAKEWISTHAFKY